jgi:hypothetical protein
MAVMFNSLVKRATELRKRFVALMFERPYEDGPASIVNLERMMGWRYRTTRT